MTKPDQESKLKTLLSFLEDDPNDVFSHYAIAMEYERLRDVRRAIEQLHEVLRLDSSYIAAYQQLGRMYVCVDEQNNAAAILNAGIALAEKIGDRHARQEMQESLDEL